VTWLVLGGWLAGWALLWRLPRPTRGLPPADVGTVSVVIPARNEADRLPLLLAGLLGQSIPPDQIVVVDDASADDTAAVARSYAGVEVVAAPPVPEGWTGKSWACATGVAASSGDTIVFLDADVQLADDALGSILATWSDRRGLLSVQPHHHVSSPVEALSLPFNVISMMGIGIGSVLPTRRQWAAAGPCMVTSRSDYALAGGHSAVRGEVAEDLALAGRFDEVGLPVRCLAGGALVRFRMYRNLRQVFEGWGKNLATGARRTPVLRGLATAWWVSALLSVAILSIEALVRADAGALASASALYGAVALQVALLARQVGRFGWAAAVWPVLFGFFIVVFAWSAVRTLVARQVTWSGRTIRVAARH
jgi:4,4'-diaponeurosporenoate glycosyltransferase